MGGLTALVVLYGVFRRLDKYEGPRWLFRAVTLVLTPVGMVFFVASAMLTIVLLFVSNISGTIWEYGKSRFA